MPRLHFKVLVARRPDSPELLIPRPASALDGYTPVMLVSEWLTLNCRADWACRAEARGLRVRFADASDRDRAVARFLSPDVVVGLSGARPRRRAAARRRAHAAA